MLVMRSCRGFVPAPMVRPVMARSRNELTGVVETDCRRKNPKPPEIPRPHMLAMAQKMMVRCSRSRSA